VIAYPWVKSWTFISLIILPIVFEIKIALPLENLFPIKVKSFNLQLFVRTFLGIFPSITKALVFP